MANAPTSQRPMSACPRDELIQALKCARPEMLPAGRDWIACAGRPLAGVGLSTWPALGAFAAHHHHDHPQTERDDAAHTTQHFHVHHAGAHEHWAGPG